MQGFGAGYTVGLAAGVGAGIAIGIALKSVGKKISKQEDKQQKTIIELLLIGMATLAITLITALIRKSNTDLVALGVVVAIIAIVLILWIVMHEKTKSPSLSANKSLITMGTILLIMGVSTINASLWPTGLVFVVAGLAGETRCLKHPNKC